MKWKNIAVALACCGAAGTAGAVGRAVDVTVVDRAAGRTLPVYHHDGRHYVVGRPGHAYHVRLRNRTGADILAVVSVDGVNAVSGETAHSAQTGYVLGPHQGYDIKGWRKSTERVAAFYFTEHRQSYAARTGRPDHVGVIGVAVFRKKARPEARIGRPLTPRHELESDGPGDSPFPDSADAAGESAPAKAESADASERPHAPASRAERRSRSLGTGHGHSVSSPVVYAPFERASAGPSEVIAIHYDTYANLVAMGVVRAPRVAVPAPFPGQFVPDP